MPRIGMAWFPALVAIFLVIPVWLGAQDVATGPILAGSIPAGPWLSVGPLAPGDHDALAARLSSPGVPLGPTTALPEHPQRFPLDSVPGLATGGDVLLIRDLDCASGTAAWWCHGANGSWTRWLNGQPVGSDAITVSGTTPWFIDRIFLRAGHNRIGILVRPAIAPSAVFSRLVPMGDENRERSRLLTAARRYPGAFNASAAAELLSHWPSDAMQHIDRDPTEIVFGSEPLDPAEEFLRLQHWFLMFPGDWVLPRIVSRYADLTRRLGLENDIRRWFQQAVTGAWGDGPGQWIQADPWAMLGPFPIGNAPDPATLESQPLEEKARVTWAPASYTEAWCQALVWNAEEEAHNFFDLIPNPSDHSVCFARRVYRSGADQDVLISYGADDFLEGWLNGEPCLEIPWDGGCVPRQRFRKARLRQGENTILLRVKNLGGGFGFACELVPLADWPTQRDRLIQAMQEALAGQSTILARRILRRPHWNDLIESRRGFFRASFMGPMSSPLEEIRRVGSIHRAAGSDEERDASGNRLAELADDLGIQADLLRQYTPPVASASMEAGEGIRLGPWFALGNLNPDESGEAKRLMDARGWVDLASSVRTPWHHLFWEEIPEWSVASEFHDLAGLEPRNLPGSVCLAWQMIEAPRDLEAYWLFSADDFLEGWINGKSVGQVTQVMAPVPRQHLHRIHLKKGPNALFLWLKNDTATFRFSSQIEPIPDWPAERDRLMQAIRRFPAFGSPEWARKFLEALEAAEAVDLPGDVLETFQAVAQNPIGTLSQDIARLQDDLRLGLVEPRYHSGWLARLARLIRGAGLAAEARERYTGLLAGGVPGTGATVRADPWQILGPFPRHSPELPIALLQAGTPTVPTGSGPLGWRDVPGWADDASLHDVAGLLASNTDQVVCYFRRAVHASQDLGIYAYVSGDDRLDVWLGRDKIIQPPMPVTSLPRTKVRRVTLRAGRNPFLVRLENGTGPYSFRLELEPIPDPAAERKRLLRTIHVRQGENGTDDPLELAWADLTLSLFSGKFHGVQDVFCRTILNPRSELIRLRREARTAGPERRSLLRSAFVSVLGDLGLRRISRRLWKQDIQTRFGPFDRVLRQAEIALYAGNLDEAFRLARVAAVLRPDAPEPCGLILTILAEWMTSRGGEDLVPLGRWCAARAVRDPGQRKEALRHLALLETLAGHSPQGMEVLNRLLALDPGDLDAHVWSWWLDSNPSDPTWKARTLKDFTRYDAERARDLFRRIIP